MSDHEAAESRPTIEPSIQCIFIQLHSIHEGEATHKLVDAWNKLEEFLLISQEIPTPLRRNPPRPAPYQRQSMSRSILVLLFLCLLAMRHLVVDHQSRLSQIHSLLAILPGETGHWCGTEAHLVEESIAPAGQARLRGTRGYREKAGRAVHELSIVWLESLMQNK